jgi:dTDP-4-dehydrorhamnose 3,5-epimerase
MGFSRVAITRAYLITPFFAPDIRGGFVKDYSQEVFAQNGINYELKEVFYTISHKGVIRALHFQRVKQQPKLVRCVSGHVYDVIVDLRKDSPTFKQWIGFDLTGDNFKEILVPAGFAHGYLVLEDSIVSYKCAEKFYGEYDGGIMWNDPTIGVKWPVDKLDGHELIIAEKDLHLMTFNQFLECNF